MIHGWQEYLDRALAGGYAGVRVTGDTAWLEKKDWKDFCEYEEALNGSIANQRLAVLCTYPLASCGAAEILDVVRTHQFAVTKRRGTTAAPGGPDFQCVLYHQDWRDRYGTLNQPLHR